MVENSLSEKDFLKFFSGYGIGKSTYVLIESRCFMPWASQLQCALFEGATAKVIAQKTGLEEGLCTSMASSIAAHKGEWELPPVWPAYATGLCNRAEAELGLSMKPKEIISKIASMSGDLIRQIPADAYQPYPWVNRFLDSLATCSIGLISSSPKLFTVEALTRWGICHNERDIFIFGGDDALEHDLEFKPSSVPWTWSIE